MAKNVVSKKLRRSMTPLQMEMIGIGGSIGGWPLHGFNLND